jgi:hypothetical protein
MNLDTLTLNTLTEDEIKDFMTQLASDISERCYCAGWMDSTEYTLWKAVEAGSSMRWGMGEISKAEAAILQLLAERLGMWFDPRPNAETEYPCGEYFMPLAEWEELYQASEKYQAA